MASLRSLRNLSLEELTQRLHSFASVPPYPFTAPPSDPEFDRRVKQLAKVARDSPEMLYLTSVRYHTYKDPAGDEWFWAAGGGEAGRKLGSVPTNEKDRSERHMNFSRGLPRNEAEYLAWRQSAPQVISVSYPTVPNKRRKLSSSKKSSSPPCPADPMLAVHHVPASSLIPLISPTGLALPGLNNTIRPATALSSASSSPLPLPPSSNSNVNIGSQEPTPPSSSDRTRQTLRIAKKIQEGYMHDESSGIEIKASSDQRLLNFKRIKPRSLSSANITHSTGKNPTRQLGKGRIGESTPAGVIEGAKENAENDSILSVERALEENVKDGLPEDMGQEKDKLRVSKKRGWEDLLDQSAFDLFYPPSFPSDLSCSTPNSKRSAPPSILPNPIHRSNMILSLPVTSASPLTAQSTSPLTSESSPPSPNLKHKDSLSPKKTRTNTAVCSKRKGLSRLSTRSSSSSSASTLGPSARSMTSVMERTMNITELDESQSFLFGFGGSQIERQIEGLTGFLRDELNE